MGHDDLEAQLAKLNQGLADVAKIADTAMAKITGEVTRTQSVLAKLDEPPQRYAVRILMSQSYIAPFLDKFQD